MDFLSKLDWLMDRENLNKHTLAQKSGVPYTTIVGLYQRGPENARISTLNQLCDFFHVHLDYLVQDEYTYPEDFTPNGNTVPLCCETAEEEELLRVYRSLNQEARGLVLASARACAGNPDLKKEQSDIVTA